MSSDLESAVTLPEYARMRGLTERQIEYAVKLYRVSPTRRIGCVRVFDRAACELIESALRRTGAIQHQGLPHV